MLFDYVKKGEKVGLIAKIAPILQKRFQNIFELFFEQFCENFKWFYKLEFNLKFSHRNFELKRVKYFHAINCFCHHQKGGEC